MRFAIEDYYEAADGANYAPAVMRAQLDVPQYKRLELEFAQSEYPFLSRVDIIRSGVSIIGNRSAYSTTTSVGGYGVPTLRWTVPGAAGIVIHYPNTFAGRDYGSGYVLAADSSARGFLELRGLALVGPGNSIGYIGTTDDHAVNAHFGFRISECYVTGFRGSAVYANASTGSTTNLGNVNGSQVERLLAVRNGGPATFIGGGDANVVSVRDCSFTENGLDMAARVETYPTILTGRQVTYLTIDAVADSTLYRARLVSTNCDFTSGTGATMQQVVDGMVASITSAVGATVTPVQIDTDTILVYANANAAFSTTGTPIGVTQSTPQSNTTSPTEAFCLGGPTDHDLRIGDLTQCHLPAQAFGGWLRGNVSDVRPGYGFLRIDYGSDQIDYSTTAISNVSGNTWRMTLGVRGHVHLGHIGRTVNVFGCANAGNNTSTGFPITFAQGGVYGASSIRLRVTSTIDSGTWWFDIGRVGTATVQRVSYASGTSQSLSQKRDGIINAINAAGISGVTATVHDNDEFNIVGTGVLVSPGPYVETSTVGQAQTIIEYTNASGVAESSSAGQFLVGRTGVQGAYSGSFPVTGRIVQLNDGSLIWNCYDRVQVNGDGHGDGFYSRGGATTFRSCYTEGALIAVIDPPGQVEQGNMNLLYGGHGNLKSNVNAFYPSLEASALRQGNGSVVGRLGGHVNSAFEFETAHAIADDKWRWKFEQSTQGAGWWEMIADDTTVAHRLAASNNLRVPIGTQSVGCQGTTFHNFGNGSVASPPDATGGLAGVTEWRLNGTYRCKVDCIGGIFLVSNATNATPIALTIGVHSFPSGVQGRMLIRNVGGNTNANGERAWVQYTSSSVRLYAPDGTTAIAGNGTYTSASGIAILCRLVAHVWVTGTSFVPGSGNWIAGDRATNIRPQSGDATDWVCTVGGVAGASTWVAVGSLP